MSELIIALMGLALIVSYAVGINYGVNIERRKKPTTQPVKTLFCNLGASPTKDAENEKYNIILKNLDTYDGTSEGQIEINDL